ncbi:SMC-Scp complex subunit ScpB [Chitinophaga pinensis]|uniref:SMC-Scp complex subunit ScpB n=2 Tax=Chitinophaga pinensis TaxID=79329 RepID=A0A5C6LUF2_9BACT|nr:SMC-Scp complex subunit ScpB [Chitinophaga pinensis]
MEISQIIPHIESLIFAADRPLPLLDILDLLNNALAFLEDRATLEQVEASLEAIKEKYSTEFYAFEVRESGGGYQFLTKKEYYQTVAQLNGDKFLKRLSTAALETLAIVAYKQPISKGEIEHIRGVSTDYSIQKLLEKELIVISGRSENLPGKPLLYATSKAFMDYFGLNSPKDLPKLKEVFDDESIQPTLIGLEAEANDEEARNMVVSETGELVEQDDNAEGPEAHLNGRKVSTDEIPVTDTPDKKNNDLQAKLFLPFDEEAPQNEADAAAETTETDTANVNEDEDNATSNDNVVAGTEIPTIDEALEEEPAEADTTTTDTEEEEEVTYATEEELAAFMNAAADVVPNEDEDDEDDDDEDDEGDDSEDEEDNDDDEEDEEDEDDEDDEEDTDDDDSDEDEDDDSDVDDEDIDDDDEQEAKDKENDDAAFAAAAKEDFDGEDIDDEDFDEDDDFDDEDDDDEKR